MCQPVLKPIKAAPHPARNAVSKLLSQRSTLFDIICFLIPALFCTVTNVLPIYLTGILRIVSTHLTLTAHYTFVDKDNYYSKLSQKQLLREKGEYLVGIVLHMWAQVVLQLLFPGIAKNSFKSTSFSSPFLTFLYLLTQACFSIQQILIPCTTAQKTPFLRTYLS